MGAQNRKPISSTRNRRLVVGVILCAAVGLQCQDARTRDSFAQVDQITIEVVSPATTVLAPEDEWEQLARRDPLAFLKRCRDHYDENFRDYRCTFVKQERVGDKLTPEEWTDVRFRQEPYSVDMTWTHNAGLAGRALYVEGRWTEGDKEMAWVRPAGTLVKWMKLKQWIHGKLAGRASRRTIDQFGFRNSLDLIIHYSEKAREARKLELTYIGLGQIEDRPAYVFERWLPYTGQEQPYPDRLLQVYIDKEWLVPICCLSYADDDATELLGKYVLKDVEMNLGYTDADFDPEAIGF